MTYSNTTLYKDNYMDDKIQIITEVITYSNNSIQEKITILTSSDNGSIKTLG